MGLSDEHYEQKAKILIEKLEQLPQEVDTSGKGGGDWEAGHVEADKILCDLLKDLGYGDVVAAWEKVGRWYA